MRLRILSASDIDKVISMADAINVNAQAYAMLSAKEAIVPQRTPIEAENGITLFMPAYLPSTGALTVKVVSIYPENPPKGLPTIHAMVLVVDSATGQPLGLINGTRLTALRTGAGVGVATRLLAREDAHVLAMFGAGGQSLDQVEAVLAVRPVEEVRIYTPSGISAQNLAKKLSQRHPHLRLPTVGSPAQAVRGADIIACATTSRTPVFEPTDVAPGVHINAIGSFTPDKREVQVAGLPNLRVFVDSHEAALEEAGDLIQAIAAGHMHPDDLTEIGKVVLGQSPGRTSPEEVTLFKSVGMAVQDATTAQAVLERAVEAGLGREIEV